MAGRGAVPPCLGLPFFCSAHCAPVDAWYNGNGGKCLRLPGRLHDETMISILDAILLIAAVLVLQNLLMRVRSTRKNGKGMVVGGTKSISDGRQQIRDGRKLLSQSVRLTLLMILFLLLCLVIFVFRIYIF